MAPGSSRHPLGFGPEALIIGGGPAGAALGILLARHGCEVEIIEQSAAMHHKVCGEFLSHEAVSYLRRLGLDPATLGAEPIHGVRLVRRTPIAECELPFGAMSITRRKLDEALLAFAAREGVSVRRGRRVEQLRRTDSDWHVLMTPGETLRASTVFLATGKHDIAGYRRPPGKHNGLVAFKMYFHLAPRQQQALRDWVELVLFPGGYAGLQLTEDGDANLCLLVGHATLHKCGNDWTALLEHLLGFSEHLAERLQGAQPLLRRPLALSSIPYGMLLPHSKAGVWRVGDQAAVTPSFSGDGMSIALHSAMTAAELYLGGSTADQLAGSLHRQLRRPIAVATILSRLMIGAPALAFALRPWPELLGTIARETRVPPRALVS